MKEKKSILIGVVTLILACIICLIIYRQFAPEAADGEKTVVVHVIHADQSEKKYTYHTDAEYLGEVLEENELVEGDEGEYGLFITSVDGEKADDSKQQWWCITKSSEQVNTAADKTVIEDGDNFELTLKEGY